MPSMPFSLITSLHSSSVKSFAKLAFNESILRRDNYPSHPQHIAYM